jgi:hypothetical protein
VQHDHADATGVAGLKMVARYADLFDLHRLFLLLSG